VNHNLDDVFYEDWPDNHRSGVVAVVGRPNVGKSTLINRILGQKIAIVTAKPQTTRKRQLGIYSRAEGQILFVDTPGLHKPHNRLGEYMVNIAESALRDADVILWVLDGSEPPQESDRIIGELIAANRGSAPVVLAINKSDLAATGSTFEAHHALIEHIAAHPISALLGTGVEGLVSYILEQLPLGPRYYPIDQISEVNQRFIAAEVIREKIIENTEQEIPYSVAIEISEFKERSENLAYISAIIYVERDSQKGIIIGKKGSMIKLVGSEARQSLSELLEIDVFLDLHVKVLKNWRSNNNLLRRLGYFVSREDSR
jgi:GTPase